MGGLANTDSALSGAPDRRHPREPVEPRRHPTARATQLSLTALAGWVTATGLVGGLIAALVTRSERHILEAIETLTKRVDSLEASHSDGMERIHKVELSHKDSQIKLAEWRADLTREFVSRPEWNRSREDMLTAIAQTRSFCARRHGEGSNG